MSVRLTRFEELRSAVKKFDVFDFSKLTERVSFETGVLDTDLSNIFQTNQEEWVILLKDGSIKKAVIHIVDISSRPENWGNPKIHIHNCKTIKKMKEMGRVYRYKASGRKDGQFFLIKEDKKWRESLEICSHCLKIFNHAFELNKTKATFSIREYLDKDFLDSSLPETEWDICAVPDRYTGCWPEISKRRKIQENYTCEKCGIDLSKQEDKKFLHTHHTDGNKANNIKENLKVLCIKCHAMEPGHSHIKSSPQYKEFIRKKKEEEL